MIREAVWCQGRSKGALEGESGPLCLALRQAIFVIMTKTRWEWNFFWKKFQSSMCVLYSVSPKEKHALFLKAVSPGDLWETEWPIDTLFRAGKMPNHIDSITMSCDPVTGSYPFSLVSHLALRRKKNRFCVRSERPNPVILSTGGTGFLWILAVGSKHG